jgi:tetratricopeptide (TPR) repeat protein
MGKERELTMGFNNAAQGASPAGGANRITLDLVFSLMSSGKYASALLALKDIVKNSTDSPVYISVNFNLALCYIKAGEFKDSMPCLEKALTLVKKIRNRQDYSAGEKTAYMALRIKEIAESFCFEPMPEEYPLLFTGNAEEDIIITLIIVYRKCNLEGKAAGLLASLAGPEFSAFKETNDHTIGSLP